MEDVEALLKGRRTAACWACGSAMEPQDNYCRVCGKGQGARLPWQYKWWGILAITVLGLGPFSLFYLWRTPDLSRRAKPFYAAAILLFTLFVMERMYRLWVFWQAALGGLQSY